MSDYAAAAALRAAQNSHLLASRNFLRPAGLPRRRPGGKSGAVFGRARASLRPVKSSSKIPRQFQRHRGRCRRENSQSLGAGLNPSIKTNRPARWAALINPLRNTEASSPTAQWDYVALQPAGIVVGVVAVVVYKLRPPTGPLLSGRANANLVPSRATRRRRRPPQPSIKRPQDWAALVPNPKPEKPPVRRQVGAPSGGWEIRFEF